MCLEEEDRQSVATEEKGWSPNILQVEEEDCRRVTAKGKSWLMSSLGDETTLHGDDGLSINGDNDNDANPNGLSLLF